MSHYSEMSFLFSSKDNQKAVNQQLESSDKKFSIFDAEYGEYGHTGSRNAGSPQDTTANNTRNIFTNLKYTVYKGPNSGTDAIKNYLVKGNNNSHSGIYKNDNKNNPYVTLLKDFDMRRGEPGAGLRLKAADLAYLRDLGVYPLNRMCILRRFAEGQFLSEDLGEMVSEPISTVIGWLKPDKNFGDINFNENWGKTNKRFDVLLNEIIKNNTGGKVDVAGIIPIPDFAQGVVFEFYQRMGLTDSSGINDTNFESYDAKGIADAAWLSPPKDDNGNSNWGLLNIPVGNPNVLMEGPFRDPVGQNINSTFSFELETTYEQKFLGDIDPGNVMLDIIDNLYAMGTSDMVFYWGDNSPSVKKAIEVTEAHANDLNAWWVFVSSLMKSFWDSIVNMFKEFVSEIKDTVEQITENRKKILDAAATALESILTSTIAIHRFELRGSIELMTGGKISSSPWHLTIGNPYSPWLSTNHIIVKSGKISTSTEMGFNDQPQQITATFTCEFSRSLGKQELMRMFNNSYRRTYASPPTNITHNGQVFRNEPWDDKNNGKDTITQKS